MKIELKYQNPDTEWIFHHYFDETEIDIARSYLDDAIACNQTILIWRLIHDEDMEKE